jgi:hypothetical protein
MSIAGRNKFGMDPARTHYGVDICMLLFLCSSEDLPLHTPEKNHKMYQFIFHKWKEPPEVLLLVVLFSLKPRGEGGGTCHGYLLTTCAASSVWMDLEVSPTKGPTPRA